jgi:hypothetical protein
MRALPPELLSGPFHMRRAAELGVTRRVLERRFVRVHPRVWRHPGHAMTHADRVTAAALAMPEEARLTGISRIQQLGLDYGPRDPIRFVVRGDLHIATEGVFLHRTKCLPPIDDVGVTPAAAFIAYCARARVIDAIKVGDWLLYRVHMTIDEVRALALRELWRPGAHEAIWILEHLDGRARSLPESEVRALLVSAGLPVPELNVAVDDEGRVICDLVYRRWRTVVEHAGRTTRRTASSTTSTSVGTRGCGARTSSTSSPRTRSWGTLARWWARRTSPCVLAVTTARRRSSASAGSASSAGSPV